MVELGGIEPPSISRWMRVIRPFPLWCCRNTAGGSTP